MPVFDAAFSFAGLLALALSMDRHFEAVFGKASGRSRAIALKVAGWTALALAATRAALSHGASVSLTIWMGELSVAALLVVLLVTYGSRSLVLACLAFAAACLMVG